MSRRKPRILAPSGWNGPVPRPKKARGPRSIQNLLRRNDARFRRLLAKKRELALEDQGLAGMDEWGRLTKAMDNIIKVNKRLRERRRMLREFDEPLESAAAEQEFLREFFEPFE